jgi:hypothetical protein
MKTYLLTDEMQIIGRAGEQDDIVLAVDVSAWQAEYSNGVGSMLCTCPDGKPVPIKCVVRGTLLKGELPDECMSRPGVYQYTANWVLAGVIRKSQTYKCIVLSTVGGRGLPPECRGTPAWATEIFVKAEQIDAALDAALQMSQYADDAMSAKDAALAAQEAAEDAKDESVYAKEQIETMINESIGSIEQAQQIVAEAQETVDELEEQKDQIILSAQEAVDGIDEQRNTMIAAIASVAGQGTDTTLTQSGVAADAEAVGDQIIFLKNATDVYDYLTNGGQYTITASALESGVWSYTTKSANTKRLRTKALIPVRVGMKVYYSTQTDQMVYVGVAPTPTSGSTDFHLSGWVSGNGVYTIPIDGYMTFNVKSNPEAVIATSDFDSTVTIHTVQKDSNDLTRGIVDDYIGKPIIRYTYQGSISAQTGNYYSASNRAATEKYVLPAGVYSIKAPDGYKLWIYKGGLYGGEGITSQIFDSNGVEQIAFVLGKLDDSALSPADVKMMFLDTYTAGEIIGEGLNGVTLAKVDEPLTGIHFNAIDIIKSSKIYKMPKSGINLEQINVNAQTTPTHTCMFYRMSNGTFVPATDYEYSGILWDGNTPTVFRTRNSLYYPYDDNLYYSVLPATDATSFPDDLYVSYGTVRNGNGRLTNLAPATIGYGAMPAPNQSVTGYYPSFTLWYGDGYITEQYFYGTVIRLQDAKAICCSAELSMSCWWYDKDGVYIDSVIGSSLSSRKRTGINYIDLSKHGDRGYCVVLIRAPFTVKQPVDGQTSIELNEQTMGGLHLYDYVLNNVYVQYYNKTFIEYDMNMHPVLAHNIDVFKNLVYGDTMPFKYGGAVTAARMQMDGMKNCGSLFYAGAAYVNAVPQNVSFKSYMTAVKNPNSRVYISDWTAGKIGTNYGMVCNNLPNTLYGMPWMARVASWYQTTVNTPGCTVYRDFDFYSRSDEIRIGDWIIGENEEDQDAHIVQITNIVHINGAVVAIEGMESYPPMVKYRYLFLDPMLERFNLEFSRKEPIGDFYNILVKVDPSMITPIEEAFGTVEDSYDVGSLMCDRGTDGLYTTHMDHCYITINGDIESFDVYLGADKVAEVDLSTATLVTFGDHELQAVDIMPILAENGEGYYSLKTGNDVQERFYVAPDQTIQTNKTASNVMLTITNPESFVYIVANYKPTSGIIPDRESFRTRVTYLPQNTLSGNVLTFPRYVTYLGDQYEYDWCECIYKCTYGEDNKEYGTYMVRRDEENGLTYINADGAWINPIYD